MARGAEVAALVVTAVEHRVVGRGVCEGRTPLWARRYEVLPAPMLGPGGWRLIDSVEGVSSGTTAAVAWPDLDLETEYEWLATVSDGYYTAVGPVWRFTTMDDLTGVVDASPSTVSLRNMIGSKGIGVSTRGGVINDRSYHGDV